MKIRFSYALVFLFMASLIGTVSAAGYSGAIIIGVNPHITFSVGTPGLSGGAVTGGFTLTYPDGSPVSLGVNTMTVEVCGGTGCVTVQATLTPGSTPGTYSFSFPSGTNFPTGSVTLTVLAGSMIDSYGHSFPSVNTVIGTLGGGASPSALRISNPSNLAAASLAGSPPKLVNVAQTNLPLQTSPDYTIVAVITVLSLLGVGLLAYPGRLL
jgi:hypothetical protein